MNILELTKSKLTNPNITTFDEVVITLGETLIEKFQQDSNLWGYDEAIVAQMLKSKEMCKKVAYAYFLYIEENNPEVEFNVVETFYNSIKNC